MYLLLSMFLALQDKPSHPVCPIFDIRIQYCGNNMHKGSRFVTSGISKASLVHQTTKGQPTHCRCTVTFCVIHLRGKSALAHLIVR